jgi:hypothetical protein
MAASPLPTRPRRRCHSAGHESCPRCVQPGRPRAGVGHRRALDGAHLGLLISSFRPEDEIKTDGWWNWFTDPGESTIQNYSRRARLQGQRPARSATSSGTRCRSPSLRHHPDRHRLVRGLRAVVDEVQGPRLAVRDHRGPDGGAAADVPHPAAAVLQVRLVPRCARGRAEHLGGPRDLRYAAGDLPAEELHRLAAQRGDRGGPRRRRQPHDHLREDRAAAVGARRSRRWPSSSSSGSGTTCSSPRCSAAAPATSR